ncbi:MAG: hypothetical protein JO142_13045 [Burkholderiales bacterium]|nr:hypothetical protein [Burkholderiales bacterium]
MSWNYRVMNKDGELAIYEVYYHEDGRIQGMSSEPTFPAGETLQELELNIELYLSALKKPILDYTE